MARRGVVTTAPLDPRPGAPGGVEVRRSTRRRRTVSAYPDGDRVVVLLPARLSEAEEAHWVDVMVSRVAARTRRRGGSDADLAERARLLSRRYLAGRAVPERVRWVANQGRRWASCTIDDATIRVSERLRTTPQWVLDYVLLHELAHLLEPGHGPAFWALLREYPKLERARGYLEGMSAAAALDPPPGESVGTASGAADGVD